MYKNNDELNRALRKNVFINKVKDVASFIQLINNIYKSIIGKNDLNLFFYKFDRMLSLKIKKNHPDKYTFWVELRNIKSNYQMYLEDLYSLLYLFFINIRMIDIDVKKEEANFSMKINVEFKVKEENDILVKDVLLRIKHIKKIRRIAKK